MKIRKGDYGYIRREKKKDCCDTGTVRPSGHRFYCRTCACRRKQDNIFTVVAVVGCLPGCRAAVGFIMMVMQKPVDKAVYDAIEAKKGKTADGI